MAIVTEMQGEALVGNFAQEFEGADEVVELCFHLFFDG